MDNTQQLVDENSKEPRTWLGRFVVFGAILLAIIFFGMAVTGAVNPDDFFAQVFGLIFIAAVFIAVFAFVAAIVIRLFKLLFGK
tara:strand:+ start:532 stop:783 length:252 start_codon:yes stop_codon:yes gene_type:complete